MPVFAHFQKLEQQKRVKRGTSPIAMYSAPSANNLKKCIITPDCVTDNAKPKLVTKARARISEKTGS